MTSETGSDRTAERAGFTLIELSIVVFIIGMLMAVAAPSFVRSYNSSILSDAARSFATLCQFARIQAVSQQQSATLHIDLERQRFWVSQPVRDADGSQQERPLKVVELSNRIVLVTAVRQDQPLIVEKEVDATFYPNGTCDPVYITLQGMEKGSGLCAIIDPITVRATIYPARI